MYCPVAQNLMTWLEIKDNIHLALFLACHDKGDLQILMKFITRNVFIQVGNIRCTGSLRMGTGSIFKVGGNKCTSKNYKICDLNWQLLHHKHWNMTSLTFVSMFKQYY